MLATKHGNEHSKGMTKRFQLHSGKPNTAIGLTSSAPYKFGPPNQLTLDSKNTGDIGVSIISLLILVLNDMNIATQNLAL